ncbi:ribbon-helix-helix protein, CopG family [Rhizobium sp. NPDC090279]|uniref:ribbon-helix-helix protein, CopG family n=1 Tax=Rhizobium sp. NPDC090279 TaxID=3364499 RepID=UPI003839DC72
MDIGDPEVKALDRLAQREKTSRAALIRKAVDDFLARNSVRAIQLFMESLKRSIFLFSRNSGRKTAVHFSWSCSSSEEEAFGLWGDRKVDGLAYQKDIRSES